MLGKFLIESTKTVVFSGAGMSTESGLTDFRSADQGIWNHRNPAVLASVEVMENNTEEFVSFYHWRIEEMQKHSPNTGHRILYQWEKQGLIYGIITQNVENYHEIAGNTKIAKLHGDLGTLRCVQCLINLPSEYYLIAESASICPSCGGFLRPNVVLFGEVLPSVALKTAQDYMNDVQLFIVLGSSLQVSPANQFPKVAKKSGARLVIINKEPTPVDDIADIVVHNSIGEVLTWTDHLLQLIQ